MNSLCSSFEFKKHFENFLAAYPIADQWQRGDAMREFINTLSKLSYIRVSKSEVTTASQPMIEVKCQFALAMRLPDLVQIDLTRVWDDATSEASYSYHTFERTPLGIDGHFLAVAGSIIFTYCLHVAVAR